MVWISGISLINTQFEMLRKHKNHKELNHLIKILGSESFTRWLIGGEVIH